MSCHHVLCSRFSKLDIADGILECGKFGAGPGGCAILADFCVSEFELFAVWVTVYVDVCYTHCDGGPETLKYVWVWCCVGVSTAMSRRPRCDRS